MKCTPKPTDRPRGRKLYALGNGGFVKDFISDMMPNEASNGLHGFEGCIFLKNGRPYLEKRSGPFFQNAEEVTPFDFPKRSSFFLAAGSRKWRRAFLDVFLSRYPLNEQHFPNMACPSHCLSPFSSIGFGNVFLHNTLVRANASMGNFNFLNAGAIAYHDTVLGDNNMLLPYSMVLGASRIGDDNVLASYAAIAPKVCIGDGNTLSAGEFLFEDMGDRQFFKNKIVVNKP